MVVLVLTEESFLLPGLFCSFSGCASLPADLVRARPVVLTAVQHHATAAAAVAGRGTRQVYVVPYQDVPSYIRAVIFSGMVWCGVVRYGMVWYIGMAWCDICMNHTIRESVQFHEERFPGFVRRR